MFKLCLFDLDDTLISTGDLKEVREACKNNNNPKLLNKLKSQLDNSIDLHIFRADTLRQIRKSFPSLKLGIFTRSPRSYASTVLEWAYPGFNWDIVIAYEDVRPTKPFGTGIHQAMDSLDVEYLDEVILIGDNEIDIRAGYNGGCIVALSKKAWPYQWNSEHWRALERIPDAIIDSSKQLLEVIANPTKFLPELECLLEGSEVTRGGPRFDKINHFIPQAVGGGKTPYPIYVCGRSFANYESLCNRRNWHGLTKSIEDNKDSDTFPDSWISAIRNFIQCKYFSLFNEVNVAITVVPHRPGRKPRMEYLLKQLEKSIKENPIQGYSISCHSQLLAYKNGVRSQHNDHLGRNERFVNVRDHLFVNNPELINHELFYLIIDDVTTTGASLIYASKYLKDVGAGRTDCLSMAKNISEVL